MAYPQPHDPAQATDRVNSPAGCSHEPPRTDRAPSPAAGCDCEHKLQMSDTVYLILTDIQDGFVSTNIFVNGWIVASKHSPIERPGDEEMLAAQVAVQQMSTLKQVAPDSLAWWTERFAAASGRASGEPCNARGPVA